MLIFLLLISLFELLMQANPTLVGEWAYSDAFPINNELLFCYKKKYTDVEGDKGGIARYKYDLTPISDLDINEFSSIYGTIRIYYINENSFILFERPNINIIKDNTIIYTISSIENLGIISESKFLTLSFQSHPEYIIYHIYDINSGTNLIDDSPTYNTFTSTKV